ncbi:hypothetical protein DMA10_10735 [Streptomyces sp. WAC 01420]|nr:hypothetical protein DLM49_17380 [Streptomyces sp. WAC 01438]RSM97832.1 hypothetical protein DMA10_10735 [Streptomyces sp. WAC 01420]
MPFVTTTVHVPSAQARSWAGVEGFIGFAGVGDGSGEDRVGAGEADDGSAEREGAPEAAAFAPSSSEPQPVSAAARTRAHMIPARPADDSHVVMARFYARAPGRGPPPRSGEPGLGLAAAGSGRAAASE